MIIDAFMFGDELEILELRLGQLDSVVDKFVIIESGLTFQGKNKPLHFQNNRSRFNAWNHKIVHAIPRIEGYCAWDREKKHREALSSVILGQNYPHDSTLSFSDCDEIPNPEILRAYSPGMGLRNLKQYTFYYNFNNLFNYGDRSWSRARLGTIKDLVDSGVDTFRGGPRDMDPTFPFLEKAGWHCSWFGSSLNRIREKVNAFSHDDLTPYINRKSDAELAQDVADGVDLFHREGIPKATHVEIGDPILPPYFLSNTEKFKEFTNNHFIEVHKHLLR